jgi:polyadenylate-binding protein
VIESVLYDLFNKVGPVASIRVCRDTVTRRSLGYAYVNFHNVKDAERALDTMNFTDIKGRACRIMWSQRDPSLRKSGVGNIFVKNLPSTIDNRDLFDNFSEFGNILSGKVATDENGNSKGYGYVHYETAESAAAAIEKFHNKDIEGCVLHVCPFVKRQERAGVADWTNVYVKQFPESWDEGKLKEFFSESGEVANVSIARDEEGKSKKFGFVNFTDHAAAEKAVADLHGKTVEEGCDLYISKAQKKSERSREIKSKLEQLRGERISKFQGMNLYVKNIDDEITDEQFREAFAVHGTITSARIMRTEEGTSRGFGYVCYSTPEEATKAVNEMHGKMLKEKPLVVTLHQRKDIRRAHLAATMGPRPRFPMQGGQMPFMPMPYMQNPNMMRGQYPMMNMMPRGPRGAMPGYRQQPGYPMPPYAMPGMMQGGPQQMKGGMRPGPQGMGGQMLPGMQPGQQRGPRGQVQGGRGMKGSMQQGGMPAQGQQAGRMGNVKFNGQARNQPTGQAPPAAAPAAPVTNSGGIDVNQFSKLGHEDQKNLIGERLYPLISAQQPALAGKITGMLLEMDNAELLHLLESTDALYSKIEEAMQVLKAAGSSR